MHVRSNHNRASPSCGFNNVMPAASSNGPTNEHHASHGVNPRQFAHGVEKKNAGKGEPCRIRLGAAQMVEFPVAQFYSHGFESGRLPGRQDEQQFWKLGTELFKSIEDKIVFVDIVRGQTSLLIRTDSAGSDPDLFGSVSRELQG